MMSEKEVVPLNYIHKKFSKIYSTKYFKQILIIAALIFFISGIYIFFSDRSGWLKDFPALQLVGLFVSSFLCTYLFILNLFRKVNHESNIKKR